MSRLLITLGFVLVACHATPDEPQIPLVPDALQPDDPAPAAIAEIIEPTPLPVVTYDGSGEIVHPDAVVFPHAWNGSRFWYTATPYPLGNPAFENPSAYLGDSGDDWRPVPGITNPLAMPAELAYLSDPDLSYDPIKDELRLYYRQTRLDKDELFVRTSSKGYDWSPPALVVTDARYALISPAIVREQDGSWRMWAVSATTAGCKSRASALSLTQRRSRDGITWGSASRVTLAIPTRVPWHWDVQYVPSKQEYWALVAAYPDGADCSWSAVYFARSKDGTTWTVSPTPLLAPGTFEPMRDLVYRSTFRYFAAEDAITVWFSGARAEDSRYHYSLATARYPYAELLRRVNATGPSSRTRAPVVVDESVAKARAAFVAGFP